MTSQKSFRGILIGESIARIHANCKRIMHGEKFATPNPARIAFISGYVRRRRHMNEPPGKRRFVRSEKTDEFHVRTCHPNMKSHPARKQNRVRQPISLTKTQKGIKRRNNSPDFGIGFGERRIRTLRRRTKIR